MIGLLFGPLGRWAAAGAVILAALTAVYWAGGREARQDAQDARQEIQTRERMDDAVEAIDRADDDQLADWLRRRAGGNARPLRWH